MTAIPAGAWQPLYTASDADRKGAGQDDTIAVEAYFLDARSVTNAAYLAFVQDNPKWQRSRIGSLRADPGYLEHWEGDLLLGPAADPDAAVVNVSWFAARAYCKSQGKRLPTVAEWEFAASASPTEADGSDDESFRAQLLEWYAQPAGHPHEAASSFRNYYGAYAMHGVIWEWVNDFNTALVSGESRADAGLDRALFCGSGSVGAADFTDYTGFMRFAFRSSLEGRYAISSLGFRCACSPPCTPI